MLTRYRLLTEIDLRPHLRAATRSAGVVDAVVVGGSSPPWRRAVVKPCDLLGLIARVDELQIVALTPVVVFTSVTVLPNSSLTAPAAVELAAGDADLDGLLVHGDEDERRLSPSGTPASASSCCGLPLTIIVA